ncbi:MAG: thioesterase [Christensenellaceae bacterium]|nr:thioesterase [Christensenellaceae bacterium]
MENRRPALPSSVYFDVAVSDCDADGRLKPSALLTLMQELAEVNAAGLGAGRVKLVEDGICWVLYRLRYAFSLLPAVGDRLRATTWPSGLKGPFFERGFRFEDTAGAMIGEAITTWVLFDIDKRRVLRPSALKTPVPINAELSCSLAPPGALRMEGLEPVERRTVRYTELDVNGHMNNARYADWALDLLRSGGEARPVRGMQINFIAEGRLHDQVTLSARLTEAGALIEGRRDGEARAMFEIEARY